MQLSKVLKPGTGFAGVTHTGQTIDMPEEAKDLIRENLELVFHEAVFMSEADSDATRPIPKLPKYWGSLGGDDAYSWLWHLDVWRVYFDNNDPSGIGDGDAHDVDNFIHLVTANDLPTPQGGISGYKGLSTAEENVSTVYPGLFYSDPLQPDYYRIAVWAHELFHQFQINRGSQCPESGDHCTGTESTVPDHPHQCLMNPTTPTQTYYGSYIGVGCAVPNVAPEGRTICYDDEGKPKFIRYNNDLNAAP